MFENASQIQSDTAKTSGSQPFFVADPVHCPQMWTASSCQRFLGFSAIWFGYCLVRHATMRTVSDGHRAQHLALNRKQISCLCTKNFRCIITALGLFVTIVWSLVLRQKLNWD